MANPKVLEMKQGVVNEIRDKINSSSSVIFFDYRGLTDEQVSELRRKLRENDAEMKVYKNTLTKRALDELKLSMDECVVGPSAVAFGKDSIGAIKTLTNYAKEHEILKIKGGIVDGSVSTLETLSKLATIPSRDTLLTMLAGGMIGIVRDLSIALNLYAESKAE
jgi:large subunit ribosomal protein L10